MALIQGASKREAWVPVMSTEISHLGAGLVCLQCPFEVGALVVLDCFPRDKSRVLVPGRITRVTTILPDLQVLGIEFDS